MGSEMCIRDREIRVALQGKKIVLLLVQTRVVFNTVDFRSKNGVCVRGDVEAGIVLDPQATLVLLRDEYHSAFSYNNSLGQHRL